MATGIAQKTVPLTGLRKMPIALPPQKEQERIIVKLDQLMSICEQLKSNLQQAQQTQLYLADSVIEQHT
nr:hypothetical protein [Colwellia sp. UCD-KL20]